MLDAPLLISRCTCGFAGPFGEAVAGPEALPVARCRACGTLHQVTRVTRQSVEEQYLGEYHASADRHPGCTPYAARYAHDLNVAARRWQRYEQLMNGRLTVPNFHALDVGAANGAFVDYLRGRDLLAEGLDPDPAMTRDNVRCGRLEDLWRWRDGTRYSLLTYHDVLEHLVDPLRELERARDRLRLGGLLIIDVPDVHGGRGDHHLKVEHLWFWTEAALWRLIERAGFKVDRADFPLPGKVVLYAQAV